MSFRQATLYSSQRVTRFPGHGPSKETQIGTGKTTGVAYHSSNSRCASASQPTGGPHSATLAGRGLVRPPRLLVPTWHNLTLPYRYHPDSKELSLPDVNLTSVSLSVSIGTVAEDCSAPKALAIDPTEPGFHLSPAHLAWLNRTPFKLHCGHVQLPCRSVDATLRSLPSDGGRTLKLAGPGRRRTQTR